MALVLNLKCVENLNGRSDRIAKVTFRGQGHQTRVVRSAKRVAYFGQTFEWPIARPIERDEWLDIQIFNYNKYLNNKVIGRYTLILQQVVDDGDLDICEPLIDDNNRLLKANITFELRYFSPDGRVGNWGEEEFVYPITDEPVDDFLPFEDDGDSLFEGATRSGRPLPAALEATQTLRVLEEHEDSVRRPGADDLADILGGEDTLSQTVMMENMFKAARKRPDLLEAELHKARDFQICVRLIEGQQLAGLDIDPVIKIQVGELHKYSSIKQSTNTPFFDEYFVFDFRESPAMIFDKMVTITAYHSYGIPGRQMVKVANLVAAKRLIGVFKCDVGTVYAAPGHQFYHKWAVLLDPKDIGEGAKGYIKCDINVIGKGDMVKAPKGVKDEDTNNIEGNLLLPAGVPLKRQRAVYSVTIYRAEDLPRTDYGMFASIRKAMANHPIAFVDAYVKVSFAGHTGKTSVKKSHHPEWKEILNFVDMFPPLCNRIRVQLCDRDAVKDECIGTHFIELSQIMDPGAGDAEGILPSYGPAWVNFYGAPRNYKVISEHDDLNEGLGEGTSYRGRLLISITTKLMDEEFGGPSKFFKEKLLRTGGWMEKMPRKEFLLFATIYDANMIDKEMKDKSVYFELSIGNYGNTLDDKASPTESKLAGDESSEEEDDDTMTSLMKKRKDEEKALTSRSTTDAQVPQTQDANYYYIGLNGRKPCLYAACLFEDLRKRLFHSNLIEKIAISLEEGLEDVNHMLRVEYEFSHRRLRGVLETLERDCENYIRQTNSPLIKSGTLAAGRTQLDNYRLKMCRNRMDRLKTNARQMRRNLTPAVVSEQYRETKDMARKIRHLSRDPQQSLPDVFVWMVCDKKRVAYHRVPAEDVIYCNTEDFLGRVCGKMQTIILRKPGKKGLGASGWTMQAKLNLVLWLGERDTKKNTRPYLDGLPGGYELPECPSTKVPPPCIIYKEKHVFQMRAYIFQARSLIGSDDTGLSDPFARVIFANQCFSTQYVDETLSPTWDETLLFKDVEIYGPLSVILTNPPTVCVEFYDYDTVGKPEFLGRTIVEPHVKGEGEAYTLPDWPPILEWHDIYRGPRRGGELLASFELLQGDSTDIPPVPDVVRRGKGPVMPLPPTIKPAVSKFRLEVVFWGVREMKRVQLLSVDRPRVDLECAGTILSSKMIQNIDKNSNFDHPLNYVDVDLPDNELFWPPITIRVVDCRKFGRHILVGTTTITNISNYVWVPPEHRKLRREQQRQQKLAMLPKPQRLQEQQQQALLSSRPEIQLQALLHEAHLGDDSMSHSDHQSGKRSSLARHSVDITSNGRTNSIHSGSVVLNIDRLSAQEPNLSTIREPSYMSIPMDTAPDPATLPGVGFAAYGQQSSLHMGVPDGMAGERVPVDGTLPPKHPASGTARSVSGKPQTVEDKKKQEKKDREKRRELIADLDWWSKYYVTREDLSKAVDKIKETIKDDVTTERSPDFHSDDSKATDESLAQIESDLQMGVVDYAELDEGKLKELQDIARQRAMEEAAMKNKGKKKKKKSAVARLKQFKGAVNEAFHKDEGDYDDDYIVSLEDAEDMEDKSYIARINVYPHELENEFHGFEDWINTFPLYRGKKLDDEEDDHIRMSGKFKGRICIYKLNEDEEADKKSIASIENRGKKPDQPTTELKLHAGLPLPKPFEVKVMVYVVKASDLHPMDLNGKADPYLIVRCGRNEINDKENRKNNQLNPVFGRLYEFDVVFPMDSMMRIQIMDYDRLSSDDLIGETNIDLENRFFSKHRPRCGLQQEYEEFGYNMWRDAMKPTQILEKLCKEHNLDTPNYRQDSVLVAGQTFYAHAEVSLDTAESRPSNEPLALEALKNWEDIVEGCMLVSEHVETRSLYSNERPGVVQGHLEMWVDMFPKDSPLPSITVDITPRQPKAYELRVVIWNTDDVVLEDTNLLTGEASSDIFVKGYLKGKGEDDQTTDVHYRSLTGEGNFNWRFLFPFEYLKAEEKIIYTTEGGMFELSGTDYKVPAKLTLQVWDADLVSADDFLGYTTFDLHSIPRPAKDSKKCTEKMLKRILQKDPSIPTLNLFKNKRCKGWWPMVAKDKEGIHLAGKVEAELYLLTAEEAEKSPAGAAREDPDGLPEPNRPDTSFLWFMNPLKTLQYIICKNYKWMIIKVLIFLLLVAFIVLLVYNVPGATVSKMFNV